MQVPKVYRKAELSRNARYQSVKVTAKILARTGMPLPGDPPLRYHSFSELPRIQRKKSELQQRKEEKLRYEN